VTFTLIFLLLLFVALAPYFVRISIWIYTRSKARETNEQMHITRNIMWPKISVILPVFNEEKIIGRKLQNLLSIDYPKDKFEVVVVDGCSNDKTIDIVESFDKDRIVLIENTKREGVTQATKDGAAACTGDVIVLTDTEAMFEPQALKLLAEDLSDPTVGAISGVEKIVNPDENMVTKAESTHRAFYNTFSQSESDLYSTAYFRGEFAAIRRNLFPTNASSERGILDVEIALAAIKAGKKAKCDPRIKFYGLAANNAKDRNRQKIQRATLNQETIIQNRALLGSPNMFGRVIFPCQFAMHITSPLLFVMSLCVLPLALLELPWQTSVALLLLIGGAFLIPKFRNIGLTFFQAQVYLLAGLFKATIFGHPKFLKQVESTRRAFDTV
jgi:hypothetical protein